MPFVSREEKDRLCRLEEIDLYEEEVATRCDALIEKARRRCESMLEIAEIEVSNYKKINEAACGKYMDAVIARCNEEKRLVYSESNRIISEANKIQNEANKKVLELNREYEILQREVVELKEEIRLLKANKRCQHEQIDSYVEEQMKLIDHMTDGLEFEAYFASLLKECGYSTVQVTRGTGDSGVDVLARYLEVPYAFQCKRYNQKVGNQAVQEVFSGMSAYDCAVGVVVTNNFFTSGAVTQASFNHVLLWGRKELSALIAEAYKRKGDKNGCEVTVRINGEIVE